MLEILILPFWIGYSVMIYKVKHRMFTVYYAQGGFIRELGFTAIGGFLLAYVTVELLSALWPIVAGVLILLAVGAMVFARVPKGEAKTEQEENREE